jgi:dTDP-glucose 4,6-dehydratase
MIVRPFNTYGPRQSARAVIPTIITQIASGRRQIKLGALHPTRDFSYVSDTVSGYMAALGSDQGIGEIVNLGSNFEISIGDTARMIADVMGTEIEIVGDDERLRPEKSEVERLCAANDKARRVLDWRPRFGGLDGLRRGLNETATWFSKPEHLRLYRPEIFNL